MRTIAARLMERNVIRLTRERARQLAVMGQRLDAPQPTEVAQTIHDIRRVQIDPMAPVARAEELVLWSRLGARFDRAELARLTYDDRALYEYQAFLYPTADFPMYRPLMPWWPWEDEWPPSNSAWIEVNEVFRRYVLDELRERGPLRSRDIEDRAVQPWRSTGWTNQRNVSKMLELLAARGEIAVSGRDRRDRIWDLADRVLPVHLPQIDRETALQLRSERHLRAMGVVPSKEAPGAGVPVEIEGLKGDWVADPELLDRPFAGRAALLGPFDRLVHDRKRTLQLFDFEYTLEMYVPVAKRRWGYYVLPVLNDDRLVARVDAKKDEKRSVLRVTAFFAERHATADDLDAARGQLDTLASWLDLDGVDVEASVQQA